jgi:predicted RNase H-like HicB family nuclease
MYRFLVIIEHGSESYGAYAPDLPGCVAVGDTLKDVKEAMHEAILLHLRGMMEDGEAVPVPQTTACYIDIVISE